MDSTEPAAVRRAAPRPPEPSEPSDAMGSEGHSFTQANLIIALAPYRTRYTVLAEVTLLLDGWEATPDVALVPRAPIDLVRDRPKVPEAPVLAVEVLSPTQAVNDLVAKAEEFIARGVRSVWLVQPALRTITVFHPGARPRTVGEGRVRDDAVGIEVALADVFDAPVTDAPVTDAPVTDAPVTDAPVTDAPTTDAPTTDAPAPTTDA